MKVRALVGAGVILLVAGWTYWPALHGQWIWDDVIDVLQNPPVHAPDGWWKIWAEPTGWHFFPLKSTVFWAEWQLWGDRPAAFHMTNVLLHVLGALLLWRVLSRLGLRHGWLAALWFTVHPLAVESVAWIAELKNVLSFPLLMLAALAWLDFDDRGRRADAERCAAWFAAALLAKSSVVMFPCGVLLYSAWKHGEISGRTWLGTAPLFALSLSLGFVTVWFEQQQNPAVQALIPQFGVVSRLAGAGGALMFYSTRAIVPFALSPVYPLWSLEHPHAGWFLPWIVLVSLIGACAFWWRTWGRHLAFGGGWFVLNLVPVLGFVPMAYHHVAWVADHFVYVSLAGLAGLLAAGVDWLSARHGDRARKIAVVTVMAVGGLLALASRTYAASFQSEEALWTRATRVQPEAWLGHHNLAFTLSHTPRTDEAIRQYEAALQLQPLDADAANNLGNLLLSTGRASEAVNAYRKATIIRPTYSEAFANLGNALGRTGQIDAAMSACERALVLDPLNLPAHVTLGDLYSHAGKAAPAVRHYTSALAARPNDAMLLNNRAVMELQLGRTHDARQDLERAAALSPTYAEARVNLGYVLLDLHEAEAAIAQWREALRIEPDNAPAHVGLGDVYVQTGRPAEAEAHYRAVLAKSPDDVEVRNNLAYALAQLGQFDAAIRECEWVLSHHPDFPGAKENLEKVRSIAKRGG